MHPVESSFPYDAPKKSARFTRDHLDELARAYGCPIPTARTFETAGQYLLFAQERGSAVEYCTVEEADDPAYWNYMSGMQWMKHIDTHASSVVACLERCISLNPRYEPRVRECLEAARKKMADDAEG
jgi:hypothetical protein